MTGISTLGQALTRIRLINDQNIQLDNLTRQLATGKITQSFSGLDNNVLASKRARANFQSLETYTNNIKNADRRIKQMLNAIEEFKAQAENFVSSLVQFTQESTHQKGDVIYYDDPLTTAIETTQVGVNSADPDIDLTTMRDLASNIFNFMGDLLNVQEGDLYLLGGADSLTQPYNNSGTLTSAISTLIGNWKDETLPAATNLTSDELISALRSRDVVDDPYAITDTIVGYSAALSAGNVGDVFIRVDERIEVKYTALANEQPFRDIMVAAAFIMNDDLPPIADAYAEPYTPGDPTIADGAPGADLDEMKENFYQVFNELVRMVNNAIDDIDAVRFRLENVRARIDEVAKTHAADQNALQSTIDDVENADMNDVAVKINMLQIQLDASYRVTASVQQLSLVNFL
ncbi:MAG: hypothetical protein H6861_04225 [Rhodospirillales bacterium]|nr:hypothetical protein [Rhodospirillales bacterium]